MHSRPRSRSGIVNLESIITISLYCWKAGRYISISRAHDWPLQNYEYPIASLLSTEKHLHSSSGPPLGPLWLLQDYHEVLNKMLKIIRIAVLGLDVVSEGFRLEEPRFASRTEDPSLHHLCEINSEPRYIGARQ